MLIFIPAGFHPLYYQRAKNLISAFSLLSSTAREQYLPFKAFLEKTFCFEGGRGGIFFFSSLVYQFPRSLGLV